jgi:myo-inositol-1-phosphate synthase
MDGELMGRTRIAIVGVGNCASMLTQGTEYYKRNEPQGLLYPEMAGYRVSDIEVVAAFDIDKRKVGQRLDKAIFLGQNNTVRIASLPRSKVIVAKGPVMDGIGEQLKQVIPVDGSRPVNIVRELSDSGAEIVVNFLPVGSTKASRFYADAAIKAGCGFVNCIPEFIATEYAQKFRKANLPVVGDDMKGSLGASVLSRTLAGLFKERGVELDRMYQLNFGGNTDFWNLLEEERLRFKRISKTETVQSMLGDKRLQMDKIRIGPSDFVPWLQSRKIAHMRFEGRGFGGIPAHLDVRLDVEDKSMAGGVVVDAIRATKIALDRGIGGPLLAVSAWTMKSPPIQYPEHIAKKMLEEFIRGA